MAHDGALDCGQGLMGEWGVQQLHTHRAACVAICVCADSRVAMTNVETSCVLGRRAVCGASLVRCWAERSVRDAHTVSGCRGERICWGRSRGGAFSRVCQDLTQESGSLFYFACSIFVRHLSALASPRLPSAVCQRQRPERSVLALIAYSEG